jgi:RNA recognition motif-containing protein
LSILFFHRASTLPHSSSILHVSDTHFSSTTYYYFFLRNVPNLSTGLRVEFARGDGRVKRKEDDRRRNIHPSETLFVVNFHEETTKREDLQMLFEPFGELVRIDMKRNYAFVQFRTIPEATKAKETTNGGKLDQSVLTVEYVARRRGNDDGQRRRRDDRGPPRGGDRRGGRDGGRDNFRGGPPSDRYERGDGDRPDRDRHDRGGGGDRNERDMRPRGRDRSPPPAGGRGRDRSPPGGVRGRERSPPGGIRGRDRSPPGGIRGRERSPPPPGYRGGGGGGLPGGHGGRSRSRSRSPPRGGFRSRSPPRRNYDDRDRGRQDDRRDGGRRMSPDNYRGRGSPERGPERGYGRP